MKKTARKINKKAFLLLLCLVMLLSTVTGVAAVNADEVAPDPPIEAETLRPETAPTAEAAPVGETAQDSADASAPGGEPEADPEAPQNLTVVAGSVTATTATIAWDHVPDKNDIDVWHADNDEYFTWGNSGSRTLTGLTPNTTYRLYITWFERPAARAHKSNVIHFTTPDGKPEAPPAAGATDLKVVDVTHNSVTLTWTPAEGIDDYWVWDSNDRYVTWANSGLKLIGGLKPETTYSFYLGPDGIQAPNLTEAQKSNLVTFTTLKDTTEYEQPPLAPPLGFKVTGVTADTVTFGWIGSPGADGYDIYVNGAWKGGVWDGSNVYSYAVPEGTADGTVLTFEVAAQNSQLSAVSANSNAITITWGSLQAPADLQVVTATRTSAALGWAPVPGATSYTVYRDGQPAGTSSDNRFTASGLTEGRSCAFTVTAANGLWESEASAAVAVVPGSQYTNVTYYTSWSFYDTGRGFKPSDIDVSKVTHINYAFSDLCWKKSSTSGTPCENEQIPLQNRYVHDGEMIVGDPAVDIANFAAFASIRDVHPHLNVLVSVGGWSWSNHFSDMAADETTRRTFAQSVVDFLRAYKLDGVDIDWEYPVEGGEDDNSRRPEDKQNFTLLMQTVREALDAAGSEDGRYYLLTIASGQGDNFVVNADFERSVAYLDFVNIMTYDYGGSWETLANHNAPIYYDPGNPKPTAARNNVRGGALGHLNGGVPSHKLVLGVPFYGKGWSECPAPGQYANCASIPRGTWESGIFDFDDLEDNYIGQNGFVRHWNDHAKVAYLFHPETGIFITYNDETSMMYSASLVKSLDIAGVMSWEISGDENRTLSAQLARDLPIDGTVNERALKAPANLALAAKKPNELTVKWEPAADAAGYEVYMDGRFIGYTEGSSMAVGTLSPNTAYTVHVLAIRKAEGKVVEVSPASPTLTVSTSPLPQPPVMTIPPALPGSGNELAATVTSSGGQSTSTVQKETALQTIKASASSSFEVKADDRAGHIAVVVPREVIEAIAAKGEDAKLTVVWRQTRHVLPIRAVDPSADIRIAVGQPSAEAADAIRRLAEKRGLTLLSGPLEIAFERLTPDQTYEPVTAWGGHRLSQIFELTEAGSDPDRMTGVIYWPGGHELRSVPALTSAGESGSISAELKLGVNGIYAAAVKNGFPYADDVAGWARPAVERADAKLLLTGSSDAYLGANDDISRAEFVSMLVRGLGLLPDASDTPFRDVDEDSPYAGDIASAARAGIVNGRTADTFDPEGAISRQEMAAVLARALQFEGQRPPDGKPLKEKFGDYGSIAGYAQAPVAWLAELGILKGVAPALFDPHSNVTKAQAAVAVLRALAAMELADE